MRKHSTRRLPLYLVLGADGAGKSSLLSSSGATLQAGETSASGSQSTGDYNLWLTEQAAWMEIAGRFATLERDRGAERKRWQTCLQSLRSSWGRPPKGVLITVSAQNILDLAPVELAAHARLLRYRLDDIQAVWSVPVPVFVVLTKCDLLTGFIEWFGALPRAERDQAWGVSFDRNGKSPNGADFAGSFAAVPLRLLEQLVSRLQAERDLQRRTRIFALPGQLRELSGPLVALVRGISASAAPQAGAPVGNLRGLYLTSARQGGTPIDRMLFAFGRDLGLERQILPPQQSSAKSFFLAGVLSQMMSAEADPRSGASLHKKMLAASVTTLLLLAAAATGWWMLDYFRGVRAIAQLEADVNRTRSIVGRLPVTADPDPRGVLPALNATRALARAHARVSRPTDFIDVTAQPELKLAAAARGTYERILRGPFEARIERALDEMLRTATDSNLQLDALDAYEMLNQPGRLDTAVFATVVMQYWDSAVFPPLSPADRQELASHIGALLATGAGRPDISLDPVLLASVRKLRESQVPAQRIAHKLTASLSGAFPADFTVASLGAATATIFVGADSKSAPKQLPGQYTIEAYKAISTEARKLAAQGISPGTTGTTQPSTDTIIAQVMADYRTAYSKAWTQLIDDLRLAPAATNQEAIRQSQALGDPAGPLVLLLRAISLQTPIGMHDGTGGPIAPADPFADRFQALGRLVARDSNGVAPLDSVLQSFRELQALRAAVPADKAPSSAARLAQIASEAKREPEPVRSMLLTLAAVPGGPGPTQQVASSTALSREIGARLAVSCLQLVAGRFPFDRRAERDAPLGEFARLFAPKGSFDDVFRELLATRVDSSSQTWRTLSTAAGPGPADLERFRAAARIRQVFFAHGRSQPGLQLTFLPVDLDEDVDRFQLEIDGQIVRYAHGPVVPSIVKWPGPQGHARIELTPVSAAGTVDYKGPWALFRLLDHAAIREDGPPGHFRVVFDLGGKHASFDVGSDTGANPFRLRELEQFQCPVAGR